MRSIAAAGNLIGDIDDPVHIFIRWIMQVLSVIAAPYRHGSVLPDVFPKEGQHSFLVGNMMEEIACEDKVKRTEIRFVNIVDV